MKKRWAAIAAALSVCAAFLAALSFSRGGKGEGGAAPEGGGGQSAAYVTYSVTDYDGGRTRTLERRYDAFARRSAWFLDGERVAESGDFSTGEALAFEPDPQTGGREEPGEPLFGMAYEHALAEGKSRILSMLFEGCRLLRVICASSYIDAYVSDASGTRFRVLVTDGVTVEGEIREGVELPRLEEIIKEKEDA